MGEGEGGEKSFSPSALSLFRFHLLPFPQKRLILRLPLSVHKICTLHFKENVVATSFKICTCSAFLYISETTCTNFYKIASHNLHNVYNNV